MKKKVIWFAVFLFLAGLVAYIWPANRWKQYAKADTITSVSNEMLKTPDLPDKVYKIYEKIYDHNESTSTIVSVLRKIITINQASCPCMEASYPLGSSTAGRVSVSMKFDKLVGPKKCLDYYLTNKVHLTPSRNAGIQFASQYYYKKSLEELTDKELAALLLMIQAPSYYNLYRNPENVKKKLKELSFDN